jgi:hypothetical protein
MKKIIMFLGLLVIAMFLVGCAQEAEKVDVIDEEGNIVGEAFQYSRGVYKIKNLCKESDCGKDIFNKGKAYSKGETYIDFCSSSTQIVEFYCEDNVVKVMDPESDDLSSSGTYCPQGYLCLEGACVNAVGCCKIADQFCQFGLSEFQCKEKASLMGILGSNEIIFDGSVNVGECSEQYCS